jgi:hypothetical protein
MAADDVHPVADSEVDDIVADVEHLARAVHSGGEREVRSIPLGALSEIRVDRIDAGRVKPKQDGVRRELGQFGLLDLHHIWSAVFADAYGANHASVRHIRSGDVPRRRTLVAARFALSVRQSCVGRCASGKPLYALRLQYKVI